MGVTVMETVTNGDPQVCGSDLQPIQGLYL